MTQPHGTDSKKLTPVPIAGRDQADTPVRLRVSIPSKPPPPPVADRYEVLRLVVDQGLPLSLAGDKLGVSSKVIGRIVQGALRRGEIEHVGLGKYERVEREASTMPAGAKRYAPATLEVVERCLETLEVAEHDITSPIPAASADRMAKVERELDELQTDYNELRDDYDRRSRLAEELSVERDAALEREKGLREALQRIADPDTRWDGSAKADPVNVAASALDDASRPGEQGEVQSAVLCPACGTPLDGKRCPEPECGAIWNMVGGVTLPDPPVTIRDVPQSEVDVAEKTDSPRQFQPGNRVRVREDCDDASWLRSVKGYRGQVGVVIERDEEDEEWPVGVEMPGQTELVCFTDEELELVQDREEPAEETTPDV